ncbi:hypothetical protein FO519_009721, partial [Halicephalobus sp. NKZ332]
MQTSGNKLGLLAAISYCIGDIIGSGIFVSPTAILKDSGSIGLSLIIWIGSALISMIGALVYVELGTCIRKSGSSFAYLMTARWKSAAAAFLFVSSLTDAMILAIQAMAFGQYFVKGINEVFEKDLDTSNSILPKLIGFTALMPLAFINLFSLKKFAARFQIIATIAKMAVIAIIIGTGFWFIVVKGKTENFKNIFDGTTKDVGKVVLALYNGLFAYNGWSILNSGTEEIDNPRRTLPIAAFVGIGVSVLVYLSMNVAYFSVLTIEEFQKFDTVAATFAERTLGSFHYAIPFLISLLLMGSMNTTVFGSSRSLLAGARHKVMPTMLRSVHPESMSPRAAVIAEVSVAIGVSFLGDLENLLNYATSAIWMQRTLVQLALLYMRYKKFPFPKDAYRNPIIIPILFLAICIALMVIPIVRDYKVGICGIGCVIAGFTIYFVFIASNRLPKIFYKIDEKFATLTTIFLNTLPISTEPPEQEPNINEAFSSSSLATTISSSSMTSPRKRTNIEHLSEMETSGNKIGVLEAISYCIGNIIGSGIFVSPAAILKDSGSIGLSLIIWIASALISIIGALVYVELGTCIRKSGSDFAYLRTARWDSVASAFLFVSTILTYPTTLAIQTMAFGEYFVKGINEVFGKDLNSSNSILPKLIGFSALLPLCFINLFSLKKFAGRFQIIATITKMIVIVIIIGTGFWFLVIKGKTENFKRSFDGTTKNVDKIVLALYNGLFAYNGWDILNFGTEEVENPRRTLPIAAFVGIGVSALVYLSMNVAYFSVLTVDEFEKFDTVAVTFAERTLGSFHYAIPFLISLLLMGSMNSTVFTCSRYLFAGAKDNMMPTMFKSVHP